MSYTTLQPARPLFPSIQSILQVTGTVNIEKFNQGFAEDANKVPAASTAPGSMINEGIQRKASIVRQTRPVEDSVRIESEIVRGRQALKSSRTTPTNAVPTNNNNNNNNKAASGTQATQALPTPDILPATHEPPTADIEPTGTAEAKPTTPTSKPPQPSPTTASTAADKGGANCVKFESESRSQFAGKRNRTGSSNLKAAKAQKTSFESSRYSTAEEEEESSEEEEEEEVEEEKDKDSTAERGNGKRRRISLWHKKQLVMYKIKTEKIDLDPLGIPGKNEYQQLNQLQTV